MTTGAALVVPACAVPALPTRVRPTAATVAEATAIGAHRRGRRDLAAAPVMLRDIEDSFLEGTEERWNA
ncbi:hypothetical protein Cci01nite_25480 [Catellatospora citrea]|uniref:Uncharacterized protein n=1 Tax=Catellatospora citrea TaxID=53366 RepID=A0A8J3KB80_9ACTN|nr:hypothetical protein Cci01nite_25480 [Catellatospora citrea]